MGSESETSNRSELEEAAGEDERVSVQQTQARSNGCVDGDGVTEEANRSMEEIYH